jgi:hypothetical protein
VAAAGRADTADEATRAALAGAAAGASGAIFPGAAPSRATVPWIFVRLACSSRTRSSVSSWRRATSSVFAHRSTRTNATERMRTSRMSSISIPRGDAGCPTGRHPGRRSLPQGRRWRRDVTGQGFRAGHVQNGLPVAEPKAMTLPSQRDVSTGTATTISTNQPNAPRMPADLPATTTPMGPRSTPQGNRIESSG